MLVPLTNEPRDYSWGSTTLIPALEGRVPSDRPEAEVWFGDHPAAPARTPAGARLDEWLAEAGHEPLPYLLKLLAAASALSIQAHPSKSQAAAGFAREEASGLARDAADRTYRDANHKPELIVAVSDEFRALAGMRDLADSRRLAAALGPGGRPLVERLEASDASPRALVAWALSAEACDEVGAVIAAALTARSEEFAQELELARTLHAGFPGDPGIVVALLMNLVTLRRGQGLFVPAGVLHAYLEGLGVEIMAASDNVLRGGLTPKHIDVGELVDVLVDATGSLSPAEPRRVAANVAQYDVPVPDFSLRRVVLEEGDVAEIAVGGGPAILLATSGSPSVSATEGEPETLRPGAALLAADETTVRVTGPGEVFVAARGESAEPDPVR
ncbi:MULTISPECIES: mannose-6-phosphate isomerase, class I [Microbacterium]|uniref:mannose-6-phosphate isomerase, class I n=1 Tax=Microbacterium TaxID=33882 RepID=UPI001469B48A|nr:MULTISPECIES: mannose-6-phosphate isomerase, class I [Microbacterium]